MLRSSYLDGSTVLMNEMILIEYRCTSESKGNERTTSINEVTEENEIRTLR